MVAIGSKYNLINATILFFLVYARNSFARNLRSNKTIPIVQEVVGNLYALHNETIQLLITNETESLETVVNDLSLLIIEKPKDEPLYCPQERYIPWSNKPRIFRRITLYFRLGYTSASWDFEPLALFWNPLEDATWTSVSVTSVHEELLGMGYDEDRWDCCINSYEAFEWEDFEYWNYTEQIQAYEALGWTNETFKSEDPNLWPETENLSWKNLTDYQKYMAASKLCYTEETWDEILPLYEWPEGFAIPDAW